MERSSSSAKRRRSIKGTKISAHASQGCEEPPKLPISLEKQVMTLNAAEWRNAVVTACLRAGNCVQETQDLLHSSKEAVEVLPACSYADPTLVKRVAQVYTDLHKALNRCMENGHGKELHASLVEASKHGDREVMDVMNRASPAMFVMEVLRAMQGVVYAAEAAL